MRAVQTSSERTGMEATVSLPANVDLHARPAADFVRTAMGFGSTLTVASGEREADAKSLLAILALGAKRGTTLRLTADGDDAEAALSALSSCVAGLTE
jgi:phosphotransferase system HPr (HPr) family protein